MKKTLVALVTLTAFIGTAAQATTVPDKADFVNDWHGVGSGHQSNNNPGDTAQDRHNFGDATAGGSGKNPTSGSNDR